MKKAGKVFGVIALAVVLIGIGLSCDDGGSKRSIVNIEVSGFKNTFFLGESFSTGDLRVTATYSDGSARTFVAAGLKGLTVNSSSFNGNVTGSYSINVTYEGRSRSYWVTVIDPNEVVFTGYVLEGQKDEFILGEAFSIGGMMIVASFSDSSSQTHSAEGLSGLTINSSAFNSAVAGFYTITVTYRGINRTYQVRVVDPANTVVKPEADPPGGIYLEGESYRLLYPLQPQGRKFGIPLMAARQQTPRPACCTAQRLTLLQLQPSGPGPTGLAWMTVLYLKRYM